MRAFSASAFSSFDTREVPILFLPGFASEGDASEVGLAVLLALVLLLLVATRGFLPVNSILFISALLISA